jgi:hypothetical protein
MNVQYSPDIFGMRDPNGTKSSGSSIECIICLGFGLAVAQQLVFTQYNIRAVSATFGQRYAVPYWELSNTNAKICGMQVLLGELLRSTQVESFDAATIVHDSVFVHSHGDLPAEY